MNIEQVERLLDELSANMLADDEGTIPVFRYSDELIAHMNETETTDPTEARDTHRACEGDGTVLDSSGSDVHGTEKRVRLSPGTVRLVCRDRVCRAWAT